MTREFFTLMVMAGVFFLATGALNALLPKFVVDEIGGTEATAGFVMGSAAFSALATRIWFGRTADRNGARRILVIGAVLGAISFVMLAFADSVPSAVAARLVLGASGAAVVTGSTMLGIQLAPESRRSQAAAYVLISFHAGMGIGPLVAERLLRAYSYETVWLVSAAFCLASGVIAMGLAFRPGDEAREPSPLIHRKALLPGLVTFLGVFTFNGFMTFVSLYGREVGMEDASVAFLVVSATMVLVRGIFGGLPDIIGPIRAGSGALVMTVIAAVVIAMWATPTGVLVGSALVSLGLSLQSPAFIKLAVDDVEPEERGSAMATFTAFYDVAGAIIGPTLGLIVTASGYRAAFLFTGGVCALGLVVLHLVVAPRVNERASA